MRVIVITPGCRIDNGNQDVSPLFAVCIKIETGDQSRQNVTARAVPP